MWCVSGYHDCFFLWFLVCLFLNKSKSQAQKGEGSSGCVHTWGLFLGRVPRGSMAHDGWKATNLNREGPSCGVGWGRGAGCPRTAGQGPKLPSLTLVNFLWCLTLLTMLGIISRATRRPEWGGVCGGSGRERVSLSEVQDLTLDA